MPLLTGGTRGARLVVTSGFETRVVYVMKLLSSSLLRVAHLMCSC
jgi:hypothetical protein